MYLLLLLLLLQSPIQPGRSTAPGKHQFTVATSGVNISCNTSGSCSSMSSTILTVTAGTHISGTVSFVPSHDASGSIGGGTTISGSMQFAVSCNGGGFAPLAQVAGSQTTAVTYITPSCSGLTDSGQIRFQSSGGGGGAGVPIMSLNSPSQVTVSW